MNKFEFVLAECLKNLELLLTYSSEGREHLLKETENSKEYLNDLIWQLSKIARNELVSQENKEIVERISERVKEVTGSVQYYKILSDIEVSRKEAKQNNKVQMSELAVTNQELYHQIKRQKRRKFNQ